MTHKTTATPEEVWARFLDIERVVVASYRESSKFSNSKHMQFRWGLSDKKVEESLTFSCSAILSKYHLAKEGYQSWVYPLDAEYVSKMPLSTTEDMLAASVPTWVPAVECSGPGDMIESEGREAGYYFQNSLKQTLKRDYTVLKTIVDTTPTEALNLYARIERKEYNPFRSYPPKCKIRVINNLAVLPLPS